MDTFLNSEIPKFQQLLHAPELWLHNVRLLTQCLCLSVCLRRQMRNGRVKLPCLSAPGSHSMANRSMSSANSLVLLSLCSSSFLHLPLLLSFLSPSSSLVVVFLSFFIHPFLFHFLSFHLQCARFAL